jgi:two-component system OmpR family sensor kinase
MDQKLNIPELLMRPAFSVEDGRITRINREAGKYLLEEGTPVRSLIAAGLEEYDAFHDGVLGLTLQIGGQNIAASVMHTPQGQLFILDQDAQDVRLQTMALVAQELRIPLAGMMATADRLGSGDSQLNRRMFQMLRVISNMSDAVRFASHPVSHEYVDAVALIREICERVSVLAGDAGYVLQFSVPTTPIYTLANRELLERAIFNLLSNAMKFSPAGSTIVAALSQTNNILRFTLEDSGPGIPADLRSSLFTRFTRQPGLEDPSHGLGLGMVLVRLAATAHGGTVLMDWPKQTGTRFTLTLAIRHDPTGSVRSPVLRIDYTGERDHALVELSDVLPSKLYEHIR